MNLETAFTMDTSSIKYGPGTTHEVGEDMKAFGCKRVMVVTDKGLSELPPVTNAVASLKKAGLDAVVFDEVSVEPTDISFKQAISFASDGNFDGFVPVGGGSSIDTAKAANLYSTYPADLLAYVNAPTGRAEKIPGRLKPLVAIPTTAGTGSETTGVAVFDFTEMHAKTAVSQRGLRPLLGILDPENTRTLPPMAAAASGLDILSHAVESLTNLPYHQRPAPAEPSLRPSYQGSNPVSDIWASRAIQMVAENIVRVMDDPDDDDARAQMMLAAAYAGIGFGNAGVQLPHAMSYPVSGMVRDYQPEGYPTSKPIVPHGIAVILNAPAAFRFTGSAHPEKHRLAASLMGADVTDVGDEDIGDVLADVFIDLMKKTRVPNGLSAVGFHEDDLDDLVGGTLPQHRITKLSPRPADAEALRGIFKDAMRYW